MFAFGILGYFMDKLKIPVRTHGCRLNTWKEA